MYCANRTPRKETVPMITTSPSDDTTEKAAPLIDLSESKIDSEQGSAKVRRSIGEIEARMSMTPPLQPKVLTQSGAIPKQRAPSVSTEVKAPPKPRLRTATKTLVPEAEKSPRYRTKTAEAKACLLKIKINLGNSHNLKKDIKNEVLETVDRLYEIVKELDLEKRGEKLKPASPVVRGKDTMTADKQKTELERQEKQEIEFVKKLEEHTKLLNENKKEMENLAKVIKKQQEVMENRETYASIAAATPKIQSPERKPMYSIVITSKDKLESGEQVYERVRQTVNAKEEGLKIDRMRKTKDRKVIVGCCSQSEIGKVRDKIGEDNVDLDVEEIKNKDPLIILYNVLQNISDEEVAKAIRTQNRHLLEGLEEEENRMEVRFRRRARNHLTAHIVLKVSPQIWQRVTKAGAVHVDMQRIRVADQSPLIQCSRCLGYGHGKRFCTKAVDVCSHCGGSHLKTECAEWLADVPPRCTNCVKAKVARIDHSAFSNECPVRRKWDSLARSTVAYC